MSTQKALENWFEHRSQTIGGFTKKDSPKYKQQETLIPGGSTLINFQKFYKDLLAYHAMDPMSIEATVSHFLETFIVLEPGKNYYIPIQFRQEMAENTFKFLIGIGYKHDEANAVCGKWNEQQVKLDEEKQKNGNENISSNNDSHKISSNPFAKLNVIGSGDLIQATENIAIFDSNVITLGNAVNFHLRSCLNALIDGLVVWGKSGTIALGLTQFRAMGTEEIMSNASTLEKALNINVGIRSFIKVMEESFSDPYKTDHVCQLTNWLTYEFGSANEYEKNLGTYLSLKQLVSITPQGHAFDETAFVNQFFCSYEQIKR